MVLTSRTRTAFFVSTPTASSSTSATQRLETLVRLPLSVVPKYEAQCDETGHVHRTSHKRLQRTNLWSSEEHERFLQGLELFPKGPWREVAAIVGTKTTRQTMTHAQKYRQKIERHMQAKPVVPTKKARRRTRCKAESPTTCSMVENVRSACFPQGESCVHLSNVVPSHTSGSVTSPVEIWSNIFDSSFFDYEFDALISSLGPPPALPQDTTSQEAVAWV